MGLNWTFIWAGLQVQLKFIWELTLQVGGPIGFVYIELDTAAKIWIPVYTKKKKKGAARFIFIYTQRDNSRKQPI